MVKLMIISGLVLLISITSSKVLYKFGVPILLIFIILGMLFGSDGIVGIYFSDYELTKELCSIALVMIMFYGGFGTNWEMAKPSATPSILMSTLGVLITAASNRFIFQFNFRNNFIRRITYRFDSCIYRCSICFCYTTFTKVKFRRFSSIFTRS